MLKSSSIKYILLFLLLVLLQVLILNRISFLNYGIPFVYIYFIIKLPIGLNRNIITLLGFFIGAVIDVFCNTPGINAAATTLAAFVCQPVQKLFFLPDDYAEQSPRLSLLGSAFMKYAVLITLIHHVTLILLESFSFINIKMILLRIALSTVLSSLLIFAFEGFSINKKSSWQKTT